MTLAISKSSMPVPAQIRVLREVMSLEDGDEAGVGRAGAVGSVRDLVARDTRTLQQRNKDLKQDEVRTAVRIWRVPLPLNWCTGEVSVD